MSYCSANHTAPSSPAVGLPYQSECHSVKKYCNGIELTRKNLSFWWGTSPTCYGTGASRACAVVSNKDCIVTVEEEYKYKSDVVVKTI